MCFLTIPAQIIKACGNEILNQGLATKISFFLINKDEINFVFLKVPVLVEPLQCGPAIAQMLTHMFDRDFVAVKNKEEAEIIAREITTTVPDKEDLKHMAKGHFFLPHLFYNRVPEVFEIVCEKSEPCVVVSFWRREMLAGLLYLKDNSFVFERTEKYDNKYLSATSLLNQDSLTKWLKGFLPSPEVCQNIYEHLDEKIEFIDNNDGIFKFLRRCGSMLANDIEFLNPLRLNKSDISDHVLELNNRSITREMPEYAKEISFPFVLFPRQKHGFACDFDNGIWTGGKSLGWYFIPLQSYGQAKMSLRVQSILLARLYNIPTVDFKWIKWGPRFNGLALRRFDLICGKQAWRQDYKQVDKIDNVLKLFDKETREIFLKRFVLSLKLGFEYKFTVLMPKPDAYAANGPDAHDFFEDRKDRIRLAPFIGQWGCRVKSDKHFDDKKLTEMCYACEFTSKKASEMWEYICADADLMKTEEQANNIINNAEEFYI